jgi:outer membrane receptor for ferrienterochelin and colicins
MIRWRSIDAVRQTCLAAIILALQGPFGPAAAQSPDNGMLAEIFNEPVTSSATGRPQLVSEAPANMEIITQDDIRRSGATTIPDVLAFLPGVYVRRYGINDYEVGIRGYDQPYNPRVLVLVNGREVFEQAYGHVPWAEIPVQLEEIRQIEVIKGPNSALYGFNAVSGVINIITYDPMLDAIDTATLRGGTQKYLDGSVVGTGKLGDTAAVRLSAGGLEANDFAPGQLDAIDAASRRSTQTATFNIEAKARPAPGVETFIEASAADSRYAEEAFSGTFDTMFRRTSALRAGGSIDTPLGLLSLSAYRNEALGSIDDEAILPIANSFRQTLYVVQTSLLMKPASDHTVRVGLEYRDTAASSPGFVLGTVGYQVYSASAMWDWQIVPKLSLTNAVRSDTLALNYSGTPAPGSGFSLADYNDAGFTEVSFNTGLVYQATGQDTIRLTLARGVQLPSLLEFGQQAPFGTFGPVVVAGNPGVRPTIVHNIEADYDRTLPAWHATLRTALFAQRNDDIISQPFSSALQFSPSGIPLLLTTNVGSSDAFGGEIGLRGQSPSGLRWGASYALVSTTNHTTLNQGPLPTSAIDYGASVPRHVIDANLGYTWGRVELDAQARWQSSYMDYRALGNSIYLEPVEVQNYLTLNGRVAYKLTDSLTLALTGQQFNTSRLYQTAGPPVERQLIVSVTARF